MKTFRADLHIHSLLSPCGDLGMSPDNIVAEAHRKGLDIIGITDHNSLRQSGLVRKKGIEKGVFVLQGAEVTTKEEIHCLAFFENPDDIEAFQNFIDDNLPDIKNDPLIFGDQVVVDENEEIIYSEEKLLTNATRITLDELGKFVRSHGGIIIPAHIDRMKNSIYSQLGLLPDNLVADALEVSRNSSVSKFSKEHPEITTYQLITDSDAHYPEQIGTVFNLLQMKKASFDEIRMALSETDGRKVIYL